MPTIKTEQQHIKINEEEYDPSKTDDVLSPKKLAKFEDYEDQEHIPVEIKQEDWMAEVKNVAPLLKDPNDLLFGPTASVRSVEEYTHISQKERYKCTINLVSHYLNELKVTTNPLEAVAKILGTRLEGQLETIRVRERRMNSHITPTLVQY